jgi:streptogramin lyase
MRDTLRSMMLCVAFGLAGLTVCVPSAWAGRSASVRHARSVRRHSPHARAHHSSHVRASRASSVRGSSLVGSLVVAGGLEEGQQVGAAEQAKLANPEAVVAREVSASSYENLSAPEAEKVAQEAFPALIDDPAGGLPALPAGESYNGFVDAYDARVNLGGGEQAILESLGPMATEGPSGSLAAIDLGLRDVGDAVEAVNPLVPVRLPKRLSEGAQISGLGLSMTPVTPTGGQGSGVQGAPLASSEGTVKGASVFFANTQTDADTIAKPSIYGFSLETLLRSARSPEQLSFQVGLPSGASLAAASNDMGVVQVVKEGVPIASISAPAAHDAAGAFVPTSVGVSGDVLTVTVPHRGDSYLYPISVDPEFNTIIDKTLNDTLWKFTSEGNFSSYEKPAGFIGIDSETYSRGQWGAFNYITKGDSKIYELNSSTEVGPVESNGAEYWLTTGEDYIEFANSSGEGHGVMIAKENVGLKEFPLNSHVCASEPGCSAEPVAGGNTVRFVVRATHEHGGFESAMGWYIKSAKVSIAQPKETHSTVSYNTSSPEIEYAAGKKTANVFDGGGWIGPATGVFEFKSKDLGLGVSATRVEVEGVEKLSKNYLIEPACIGVQCAEEEHEIVTYPSFTGGLPNGYDKLRVAARDPMEGTWSSEHGEGEVTLKVDSTPPHGITVSGLASKGEELELGEIEAHVKVEATDGEGSVPSSGVKSISFGVDGKEVGQPAGSCPLGPCTASGEWSINGAELGAGRHTLTVVATDNAGNVATKSYALIVYHASPVGMGPGSVNPESGDFALGATDVDISGGAGSLTVSRHYDSRNPKEGEEGPLGPQWTVNVGSFASLEVLPNGGVMVIGPEGLTYFSPKKGGGFEAPEGDTTLTLEYESKSSEYLLKDPAKDTTTGFTLPAGAKVWKPTISKGPVTTDAMTATYETEEPEAGKKIVEPKLELAPHPSTTCSREQLEKLEIAAKGCRALEFIYGTATKAKGENESEWGEYTGRLKEVKFIAYNPSTKAMAATGVAKYEYDKLGRLRAEWNPEISPALKTVYGYDAEGHVTALAAPGRESWAFTYGTIAGDATTGRLIKATHAPASAKLWDGETPKNTEVPKLSGSPKRGVRMGVTNGVWSNEPVAYAYQWEDCNSAGKECTPIPGATNANYRPGASDVGHTLVAQITATNGGGSVTVATAATSAIEALETTEYALPKGSEPERITTGPDGNLWFIDYLTDKIGKITTTGTITEYSLPEGNYNPLGITAGPEKENTLWFTDHNATTAEIAKITTSGTITEYSLPKERSVGGITTGPDGNVWFTEYNETGAGKIGKITSSGTITEYSLPEGSQVPEGITAAPGRENALWFTVRGKIGKITTSGSVTEYPLPEGSYPKNITAGPDGNLWFTGFVGTVSNGRVGKITPSGTVAEYSLPEGSRPEGITAGPDGNLWFAELGTGKIGKITTSGTITEYAQPAGSEPAGITAGPDNNLWFTDRATQKIGKILLAAETQEYSLPSGDQPEQVTDGPDGNLWFTDWSTSKIGKATATGVVTEYALPKESAPYGIVTGPDGNLWFTETGSNKIGKITTSGTITEYTLPKGSSPYGITVGPDGNLWFADTASSKIGKITTSGTITEYTLPKESGTAGIAAGPDGNLWFTNPYTSKIGKITTSGSITEYALPAESRPDGIVAGVDGNLWFVDAGSSKVGKITTSGSITEYALPREGHPHLIAVGPDGNLWFPEPGVEKIGKITTAGELTEYPQPLASEPLGITVGPGGNMWFTDYGTGRLGKVALSQGEYETAEYPLPSGDQPEQVTSGPDGNLWFTDWGTSKIGKSTTSGAVTEYALPKESAPYGIVSGPDGNLWFTEHNSSKIGKITTSGSITEYALPSGSDPYGIVAGPEKESALWFTESGSSKVGKITTSGSITEYALPTESGTAGIVAGPDGNLWFTNPYTSKVGKITTSGSITEYALPTESHPDGIVDGPDGNLWFADTASSKVGKITTSGSITEYALPTESHPHAMASGSNDDLWFPEPGTGKVGNITTAGVVTEYPQPSSSEPLGITVGPEGTLWFTDYGIGGLGNITLSQGESRAPQPGWTVDYNVPLEGSEAPDQMGVNESTGKPEPEKWGQKDDPEYATAIFPPDEPQSWPATNYKRATVDYIDSEARTVNVASPSGGISTKEYNNENEVERTLSAENRATALKEANPAEAAELLSTESAYNSEGQLTDTWGPLHMVRLAFGKEGKAGEEVLARNHVKYFYDEEAPGGETYDLVTKTVDGAETLSKEEFDKRTATTSYSGESNLGWTLRMPTSETTDPGGLNLTTTTKYEKNTGNVIEIESPASSHAIAVSYQSSIGSEGTEPGKLFYPAYTALDSKGNIWVVDSGNDRVEEFNEKGEYTGKYFGSKGTEPGKFESPKGIAIDSKGNLWVVDSGNDRVEEFNEKGEYTGKYFGSKGTEPGKFETPVGIAIDSKGNFWVTDSANGRVEEFNEKGEYAGKTFGSSGIGKEQFESPTGIAIDSEGNLWIADSRYYCIKEFSAAGEYKRQVGSSGQGNGQFKAPEGIAIDSQGNIWVVDADPSNNRVEVFSATGEYETKFGFGEGAGEGQFDDPEGIAVRTSGEQSAIYVVDTRNSRVQKWATSNQKAHDTETIYYTAKTEAEVEACREHPEWAGLPCETKPVAQPGTNELPELPVTTIAYNMWDQPEKITEEFGTTKRTKKTTYDSAGRPLTSEEKSSNDKEPPESVDKELPEVTDKYNKTNGTLEEQSTTVGVTTTTITSKYNTLGQLETYTDANGNTATFEYEKGGDTRLIKVADAKGSQTYHYNETTGALQELVDSSAGTFTATYDVGGKMTSESYPNGMTAYYTHNTVGEATGLEYKKLTDCTEKCTLFSDTLVPSIHGETLKQSSTLSEEPSYTYDAAGRLTQVQETPAGEGCTTRIYAYEEDSNRTSLTTRTPGTEGKCTTEGGNTEWHTYDTANRLTDPGVTYETFGNITKLPAYDADDSTLTSEYYVNNQVFKQEQNGEKIEYKLDPASRVRETVSSGNSATTVISHYDASGSALAWTSEGSGEKEKWTRNIPGIDGTLTATQNGEGKMGNTVELLLHDLQGNVVGTIGDNETETTLLKKYNSTEFGVPSTKEAPPKYAWLGASGVADELPSGVLTQDGVTYVPQTGRPLQTQGVSIASPENAAVALTIALAPWVIEGTAAVAHQLTNAEQAQDAPAGASQPPGAIPIAGDWEEGGEEGGGGGGGEASAAVNHDLCKILMRFGEPFGNELWAVANYQCTQQVAGFEVQVCMFEESPYQGKVVVDCNHSQGKQSPGQAWTKTKDGAGYVTASCITGVTYRAWSWGRVYGMGALDEVISPGLTPEWHCTGQGSPDTWENFFTYGTDGSWTLSGEGT